MPLKPQIKWEKWLDPLRADPDQAELSKKTKQLTEDQEAAKRKYYEREVEERVEEEPAASMGTCYIGPMGVVPITEHSDPCKIYDFWMMHCRFELDHKSVSVLEKVPGVECLDIFTRYRARIAFAKAFDSIEAKLNIEKAMKPFYEQEGEQPHKKAEKADVVAIIKKNLEQTSNHWAIFVQPDGKVETCVGTEEEVGEQVARRNGTSTKLYTSWESKQ